MYKTGIVFLVILAGLGCSVDAHDHSCDYLNQYRCEYRVADKQLKVRCRIDANGVRSRPVEFPVGADFCAAKDPPRGAVC